MIDPGTVQDKVRAAALRYGVPENIALSVAYQESRFGQNTNSPDGGIGVMQLMPPTAADLGVNPYDVDQNIDGGVRYLSQMFGRFGNWDDALRAYNGGPGNVARGTVSSAAMGYASQVLARAAEWLGVSVPLSVAGGNQRSKPARRRALA